MKKGEKMLELIDICFTRDHKVILDHVSLKLEREKFYAITGPNGSGKSTLAKIIMGIEKPDSGRILLDGVDITEKTIDERAKLGFGFAFQQPVCFKGITVYDLLKIAMGKEIDKKEACSILSKVGLCALNYIDREINNSLSGGELKRIEIATVLAREAKLAIFDEPEAGIDLWSFRSLNRVFQQLGRSTSGITLVISHQERILNIADVIILMEEGHITKMDTRENMASCIFQEAKCCSGGEMSE